MLSYIKSWFETPHPLNKALDLCLVAAEVEKKYILEPTKQYVLEAMTIDSIEKNQRKTQRNRDRIENSKARQVIAQKHALQSAVKFCWFLELSHFLAKIIYLETHSSNESYPMVCYEAYVKEIVRLMAKANFNSMQNILKELSCASFIDVKYLSRCSESQEAATTMATSVPDKAKLHSVCLGTSISCFSWATERNISSKNVAQYNTLFPSIETIVQHEFKSDPCNDELCRLMLEAEEISEAIAQALAEIKTKK